MEPLIVKKILKVNGFFYAGCYFITQLNGSYRMASGCREIFCSHHFRKNIKDFAYMSINDNALNNIISFITDCEHKLNLSEESRIKFQKTNKKGLIKIFVSEWWSETALRRQLLTALIKSASIYTALIKSSSIHGSNRYNDYNFNDIVKSSPYFSKGCFDALNKFLDGYTVITKKYAGGWVRTFRSGKNLNLLEK